MRTDNSSGVERLERMAWPCFDDTGSRLFASIRLKTIYARRKTLPEPKGEKSTSTGYETVMLSREQCEPLIQPKQQLGAKIVVTRGLAALLSLFVFMGASLQAQGPGTEDPAESSNRMKIDESPLDTVYLRREDGTFVPYFNIPFEVFENLYEQYIGGQGDALPEAFTLQRMDIDGKVESGLQDEIGDLRIRLRIQPHREGWVRVPLRLGSCTLTNWSKSNPEDAVLVSVDREDEYVAWIRGRESQPVELELKVVCRVNRQANQRVLRLALPTTAVSQLSLDLPTNQTGVTFASEKLLPKTEPLAGGRTRLTVAGASGDVELRYRAPVVSAASGLSVLTDMTVQVDGPDLIRYQVALDVTSLNGQDRSFIIKMPAGTQFDATEQLELDVLPLEPDDPTLADLDPGFSYLRVAFPKPLETTTRIVLFASRSDVFVPESQSRYEVDLGGFEVIDAVRQSGSILLLASRDWRLDWEPGSFVRQVSLDDTDRERPNATARFRFSRTPISLQAELYQNVSRIACEPNYGVLVGEDQIQLTSSFNYAFSGPRPASLLIDSRGWDLETAQLSGEGSVRRITPDPELAGRYRLELDSALPNDAFALTLELTRSIEKLGTLDVPLPAPVVSTLSPALISIKTVNNLELVLPVSTSSGTLQPLESGDSSPVSDSSVQVRVRDLDAVAELQCNVRLRQQRKTVASDIQVELANQGWRVQQQLGFSVEFEPMQTGYLAVSEKVVSLPSFELRLDDQPLRSQVLQGAIASFEESLQLVQFELPQPLTGRFEIQARFLWDEEQEEATSERETLEIPVVMPVQTLDTGLLPLGDPFVGPLAGVSVFPLGDLAQTVSVNMPRSMSIASNDQRWELGESRESIADRQYVLTKLDQQPVQTVRINLSKSAENQTIRTTRLDAVWVQSRVTPQFRSDRVSLKVETRLPRVQLSLPEGAELTELAVDGVLQIDAVDRIDGRDLWVDFAPESTRSEHTVELWYRFVGERQNQRWLDFKMPTLPSASWMDQAYWEVILPPDELLLLGPSSLVSENVPKWRGIWMTDQANVSTGWLEDTMGVAHQQQASSRNHRYLYSGFGDGLTARLWTGKRWEIFSVISGVVFFGGMLMVYFAWLRRPVVLLAVGCVVIGVGLVIQPMGQLLVQLVLFTGLFIVMGAFLRRIWNRPVVRLTARPLPPSRMGPVTPDSPQDGADAQRPVNTEDVGSTQTAGELAT